MNYYEITVTIDTDFPADGDDVVRIGRVNGRKVVGWFTTAEIQRWLKSRAGSVVSDEGGAMVILAQLSKTEAKR